MSQYTISHSNSCLNTTNSYNNVWNNCTVGDDRSQLLTWLSPLDPGLRHWGIQERRVNDVGEWLIQSEEFRRWCGSSGDGEDDKAVLFCYGDPGVGKTFISSLVVDRLCDQTRELSTAVTCFYFDFADRKEQSAASMLGSLLKQIVSGMETIPEEISRALQAQKKAIGGRRPQLVDIVKMLQLITFLQPTFMCIDALDECTGVQRVKLLDSLSQILEKSPGTRIFITGRPHIRAEIERRLSGQVTSVSVSPTRRDIIRYLRVRLSEDETPDAMDESLEVDILAEILEKISEMFLLVSLNIDAILQESTIYRRRERLSRVTDGLGLEDAYSTTIGRIKEQGGDKSRLGMEALMWISHAERPLRPDELCHALTVAQGSMEFDGDNIPSISTLVSCYQGLITVDKEASIVRLVHFTLQEYLSSRPGIFSRPHSVIAEICLTYLNSEQVKAISADAIPDIPDIPDTPFLRYCSLYWGVHAKKQLSDRARTLALELFGEYNGHISGKLLLAERSDLGFWDPEDVYTDFLFSGLHCASFFGIVETVAALIEMEYCSTDEDVVGCTPLVWAARNGHEEVVKILLEWEEVDPDWPDRFGKTPLSHAASEGHEEVVKILLLEEGVCPDWPSGRDETPLLLAAKGGNEGVVRILLEREEVNPDAPDRLGQTPLSHAASEGNEEVVKILLEQEGVNSEEPDNSGKTPLMYAAWNGHEEVVKILLGLEEVNPNKLDNDSQTPLSLAAEGGSEGVVKALLAEGVDPDKPNDYGLTPLSFAAMSGHEGLVTILLGQEEVNPGRPDNDGRTPLSYAAEYGREGVVKVLLGQKEVNPDKPDNDGKTPLSYAARKGHEGAVKILLGCGEVNPDKPDNSGRTPLWHAASVGHEGVVKMLLGCSEVNPDSRDNDGKTPLLLAAWYGHEGVVEILLGAKRSTPTSEIMTGKHHPRMTPRTDAEKC